MGKRGPKPKPLDYDVIERLAARQASNREIAGILGVSESTIRKRIDDDPKLRALIEKAKGKGLAALRSKQYEVAMSGDRTLLIWLGKQYLGQSDKREDKANISVGVTTWDEIVEASKEDD